MMLSTKSNENKGNVGIIYFGVLFVISVKVKKYKTIIKNKNLLSPFNFLLLNKYKIGIKNTKGHIS